MQTPKVEDRAAFETKLVAAGGACPICKVVSRRGKFISHFTRTNSKGRAPAPARCGESASRGALGASANQKRMDASTRI